MTDLTNSFPAGVPEDASDALSVIAVIRIMFRV